MAMTLIQRVAGCHKGRACRSWRGSWYDFDFEKPHDVLRWRTIDRLEWIKDWPRRIAWRIADVLCRTGAWLRGHRTQEGWHGIKGNEAEILYENLFTHSAEDAEQMRVNLDRLAALARATFWHDR